jgi:hypothetical protein
MPRAMYPGSLQPKFDESIGIRSMVSSRIDHGSGKNGGSPRESRRS